MIVVRKIIHGLFSLCLQPSEGTDNQLFASSVSHLQDVRHSQPPDSGFSEPVNNNVNEDNNNGPISLREMQNIANNNAAVYIVSENEERNRISRESVVEFEPLPSGIRVLDPLEGCADWFAGEDFPRNQLQYLREIGRGWFGRVVEGETEDGTGTTTVAVKILNQNASLEDKARFLNEARPYRDMNHENVLGFVAKCLQEDPWILIFELCSMDLHQYLIENRPKMAILNESGVPLQLMCDVASALAYMHSRGFLYGCLWSGNVLVRGADNPRAVLGHYARAEREHPPAATDSPAAPDAPAAPQRPSASGDVWALGRLVWEVCAWGAAPPDEPPPPALPCPYLNHLYQVMQLCWNPNPEARPTAAQVHALLNHLHFTHKHTSDAAKDDGYNSSDFEERWQRLKPNTIPKIDEHVAIVHAPSTSMASHFTGSDQEFDNNQTIQDSLSVDMDTAVSRSSSIMSDRDPLSIQIKSESLTNLHGSLEDVRNIYLTHNETPALECHQGNINLEESKEKEQDRSDSSVDPWLKDIITDSQDDVSYYKDVSDVIKNLDNILNSEKTSSSESSHQASPSRDNLSLECKKDYPMQTSMVKSPGISNFQNVLEMGFATESEVTETGDEDEGDRDTIGTLSHSFERHSDTISQQTLENITPETPIKGLDILEDIEIQAYSNSEQNNSVLSINNTKFSNDHRDSDLPKESRIASSDSEIPKLMELCVASMPSVSETIEQVIKQDCQTSNDNKFTNIKTDSTETKSIDLNKEFLSNEIGIKERETSTYIKTEIHKLEESPSKEDSRLSALDLVQPKKELTDTLVDNTLIEKVGKIDDINKALLENTIESSNSPLLLKADDKITFETNLKLAEFESSSKRKLDDLKLLPVNDKILPPAEKKSDSNEHTIVNTNESSSTSNVVISDEICNKLFEEQKQNTNSIFPEFDEIFKYKDDYSLESSVEMLHNFPKKINEEMSSERDYMKNTNADSIETNHKNDIVNSKDISYPQNESSDIRKHMEHSFNNIESILSLSLNKTNNFSDVNSESVNFLTESHDTVNRVKEVNQLNEIAIENLEEKLVNHENTTKFSISNNDLSDGQCDKNKENMKVLESINDHMKQIETTEQPERVQIVTNVEVSSPLQNSSRLLDVNCQFDKLTNSNNQITIESVSKPEEVQTIDEKLTFNSQCIGKDVINDATYRIDDVEVPKPPVKDELSDSTVYMDLTNDTNSQILKDNNVDNTLKDVIKSCLEAPGIESSCLLVKNDSTVYLDLPSIIKETDSFLHSEKCISSQQIDFKDMICTSTPKGSDNSTDNTLEPILPSTYILSETKVPDYGPGVTLTKLEQKYVPDNISPFESPSKSHHTDTYDENSSVVLGPFENCTLEIYKGVKSMAEIADLPKEELLAFSSNFSEINLETPSPLRDGNFLNEVPDLLPDELHFDQIATMSEAKPESQSNEMISDDTEEQSSTEKHVSPLTPPNSPGNFLASSSQQKYLVDIDINSPHVQDSNINNEAIDLNQIELQMTTKLAMAENENNLNIEYSGPLTEEGLTLDDSLIGDNDAIPESYLAGNGGSVEDLRENLAIDEERMKELRNELELKLPLAQVAGIEPAAESEPSELPPPPELVLTYGALSPIAEETRTQLYAYENDDHWNASIRTESSTSYPEPCNNSTDEASDLPTAANSGPQHSTYTIHSKEPSINHTYTVQKEAVSSKEITMSADSLNASPLKKLQETQSPIDDKTFNKNEDEKESNCERLSQVSPFLLSPTTDSSVPENSDIVAGLSTFSKTTVPTDAKSSKPSDTQCLSKATSIDSWCSNDTLYNVEENFDDLAMDPDVPLDFDTEIEKDKSESDDTLTHNEDEKEASHCSTYIIHDSKSEVCETFSPDSITANDNYTYTKMKTEGATITPSVITKSDLNDSTKNTQTKDLAYGTLMSGQPSYSNCTTELVSGMEDAWKLPQPELVRRSPIGDEVNFTPPKNVEKEDISITESPKLTSEPRLKKLDSVDITCLQDTSAEGNKSDTSETQIATEGNNSPNIHFINMAHSATSTPFAITNQNSENLDNIPINLPGVPADSSEGIVINVPNFRSFFQSAEIRPQDISSNVSNEGHSTEILLEGESKTLSQDITRDTSTKTPSYSDFENSALTKPQDVHTSEKSSQSMESGVTSEDFRQFQNSVKNRPQDLSSLIDASSLLLKSERRSSELVMGSLTNTGSDLTSQSESHTANTEPESLVFVSSNYTNLLESHNVDGSQPLNVFITDLDIEEETEQPHSIIITESPLIVSKISPNRTFDSHTKINRKDMNCTYDSHTSSYQPIIDIWQNNSTNVEKVNGIKENQTVKQTESSSELVNCSSSSSMPTEPKNGPEMSLSQNDIITQESGRATNSTEQKYSNSSAKVNGNNEVFATVNFLNETFEELMESNVDDNDIGLSDNNKDEQTGNSEKSLEIATESESYGNKVSLNKEQNKDTLRSDVTSPEEKQITSVTDDFLKNEQKFCQLDSFFPILSDIRFTGPATEIMSTSFNQDSPTEPTSPECEQNSKPDPSAEILKEWDSDSDSHSTNSSSGEFIWKDGDGHETAVVPSTHFDHQRDSGSQPSCTDEGAGEGEAPSSASGDSGSGSGSEGDEVEFVPSSWDCRAAPSKSSLRSMEQPPENKKRVVFKRQKYHCVYEYPREAPELDADSPAYLPDFSTYSEWDPSSAEDAELGYGQLYGAPNPLDLFPLRSGIAFGADYDEDFFISSSARPFESLGIMSTASQFFPGMHLKASLERSPPDELGEEFPPPPSPPPALALAHTPAPPLDFTTPDSGVEDVTPGSLADDDYKLRKPDEPPCWRADSASSSESVSPSSPGGEALGGLRHTRDRLKLDLPPSPHAPSPRHARVFSFVLDKPRRAPAEPAEPPEPAGPAEPSDLADVMPKPTFSTFGKGAPPRPDAERAIVLTDDAPACENVTDACEHTAGTCEHTTGKCEHTAGTCEHTADTCEHTADACEHTADKCERTAGTCEHTADKCERTADARGEGTLLDSGDEDSGIESSSKATLERAEPAPNVS
ncbi:unnamed protein product [Euphydryas editha]|uniref:Protein kinase domain-containing protein n=1 Tax=Euphydryas editha TaxID=104508 RepID=A0AAU9V8Y1_EUPED|nr:unnamed protein product [Euphydryas editha]